ncbi:MAG: CbiQ family ECF transporter T component [Polyangiaceae bacterium]
MSSSSAVALKLGLSLALIFGVGTLPAQRVGWGLLALPVLLVIAVIAKVDVGVLLRRTARALPFMIGLAGLALFQTHGGARVLGLLTKSVVSVCTLQVLVATTPMPALIRALRRAHVPEVLCSTIALLSRYLFLIADESKRMRRARAGRTLRASRSALWRALANSIGLLFVRCVQRAERVQAAMRARGGA